MSTAPQSVFGMDVPLAAPRPPRMPMPGAGARVAGSAAGERRSSRPAVAVAPSSAFAPGPNWPLLIAIAALHLLVIGGLLTARIIVQSRPAARTIATFNVPTVAPPPEAAPPEPAILTPPVEPDIAPPRFTLAPEPAVSVPVTSPLTAPPPVAAPQASAAPAVPSPAVASPEPIVPPDFSAAQLDNPGPAYPYLSRRAREEGVVTLKVLVTEQGRADSIAVDESSGFERLDKAALATVRRWRFVPARQAGHAVAAWVLVPITFALG